MKHMTTTAFAALILLSGCAEVKYQTTSTYGTDLAAARKGNAAAAYQIAERLANPDKYPDAKGWPSDMYDAAVWCNMIKIVKPQAPENAKCATLITGLSPAEISGAQMTAKNKLAGRYGMDSAGARD